MPGRWSEAGKLPKGVWLATNTAVVLGNGRVLVAGGMVTVTRDDAAGMTHCETYDHASGTWRPTGNLVTPRVNAEAVPLPDGSVQLSGGGPMEPGRGHAVGLELPPRRAAALRESTGDGRH
ncbi:hypothetical protein [Actinomadura rubrisoli]|uniref:Galactose oxidase n=1 Tax=Actinomadura rubrisoli TaxID=2530368 RepID=A0A4R5BW18_9ACTN|nr:hypothetical protein [Actinomadura rubrisoli]TDD91358.1 hypothetical protein E1298_12075 [Actinomadura rubrisoli]